MVADIVKECFIEEELEIIPEEFVNNIQDYQPILSSRIWVAKLFPQININK